MAKKEQDSGLYQYKGFIKLVIRIIIPILFLVFLYLIYSPTDIESDDLSIAAGDWAFLLALAVLLIAAIVFYYSPKQVLFSLRGAIKKLDDHPRGVHISFIIFIGTVIVITALCIGFRSSLVNALTRLSSSKELLNIQNILIGVFGGISLLTLAWRSASADREVQSKEKEQIQNRYDDASSMLITSVNKKSYSAHVRSIGELKDIAIDNHKFTQKCLNDICKCNEWMDDYKEKFIENYQPSSFFIPFVNEQLKKFNAPFAKRKISKAKDIEALRGITLYQARLSQEALQAVSDILRNLDNYVSNSKYPNIDLSRKRLCGIDLSNAEIKNVNFYNACMVASDMKNAKFEGVDFSDAELAKSNLGKTIFSNSILTGTDLSETILSRAILDNINLNHASLEGARLERTSLRGSELEHADLSCTNLKYADLSLATMDKVILKGANLECAKLTLASLCESRLEGANLQETVLQGANLMGARLHFCLMLNSNLYGVNLKNAYSENIIYNDIYSSVNFYYNDEETARNWLKEQKNKCSFWESIKSFETKLRKKRIEILVKRYISFMPQNMAESQLRERVKYLLEKIDELKKPTEITKLEDHSLIELHKEEWSFKKDAATKVKEFYTSFINNPDSEDIYEKILHSGVIRRSGIVREYASTRIRQQRAWQPSKMFHMKYGMKSEMESEKLNENILPIVDDILNILLEVKSVFKAKN